MNVKDFSTETQIYLNELHNDPRWHRLRKELRRPELPAFKTNNSTEAQDRLWIFESGKQANFDLLAKLLFRGD